MRLTGGPSFVFYRSQGEEILQLISSWKRRHYRPASNTSHCQSVNIDFFLFRLKIINIKYVKHSPACRSSLRREKLYEAKNS